MTRNIDRKFYPALRVSLSCLPLFLSTEHPVSMLLSVGLVATSLLVYEVVSIFVGRFLDRFLRFFLAVLVMATVAQLGLLFSDRLLMIWSGGIEIERLMPLVFLSSFLLLSARVEGNVSVKEQVRSVVYFWGLLSTVSLARYFMDWPSVYGMPFLITALLLPIFHSLRKRGFL